MPQRGRGIPPAERREPPAPVGHLPPDSALLLGLELERQGVHAVALPGGPGAVGEDVAQVAVAAGTGDLGPPHPEGPVLVLVDDPVLHGPREARPAAPRLELVVGPEELGPAAGAAEETR